MAKISELKKVELLEEAVLSNDAEKVKALFKEYGTFEFTARALGFALRFCGPEMTRILIDNGATFNYEMSPAFKRKYKCAIHSSKYYDAPVVYSCLIFPAYEVNGYNREIVPDEERKEEVHILNEKSDCNLQQLLYYSIIYDDEPVFESLKDLGTNSLSSYWTDIMGGNMSAFHRYNREQFQDRVLGLGWRNNVTEEQTVRKMKNLLECMDEEKILLFPSDFYHSFDKKFYKKYCSETMFDFFIRNTNMAERVKKYDIIYGLVDMNNASGFQYILSKNWVNKPEDLDTLLSYLQEKKGIKAEIVAAILDRQNAVAAAKGKKKAKEELTLEAKEPTVAEMKKIWGFKKQDDGTLIITSYKGTAADVVIPSVIGKDTVTAIVAGVFNTELPKLTPAQKKAREAIVSVEIPGTVKEIPEHVFFYTVRNEGNRHDALEKVILNEGVESIGCRAFEDCKGITSITIPSSVKNIGREPFAGCRNLKEVIIPETMIVLPAEFFSGTGIREYTVPKHIKSLETGVFSYCRSLESVVLPETLEELPKSTFEYCEKLTFVNLPKTLKSIGEDAFRRSGLTTIKLPDTIRTIGEWAFSDCKDLAVIDIPDDAEIGLHAFNGCNALADEEGRIIFRGRFFGVAISGWELTPEEELKPVKISPETIMSDARQNDLPAIVYRECNNSGEAPQGELKPGTTLRFGMFPQETDFVMKPLEWRVLAVEDGRALLMTEKGIICIPDKLKQRGVWADSYVRMLLNGGFFETAFSEKEKEWIIEITNKTPDNKKAKVKGGPDTTDRVFLLSLEEMLEYIPDEEDRNCMPTGYSCHQHSTERDHPSWRLRTPGKDGRGSVAVKGSYIAMSGNTTGYSLLRPAIWVRTD